jgi:aminomethyltransferase
MKKLTLDQKHQELNGKMVPFAGFEMPVQYEGVTAEHLHVRNAVGVFDVSHMGEFFISGTDALALIQKISSNDASTLTIGKAQYSCMPNEIGGIVDDLIVYRLAENDYMLVVNASNIEKDWNWINQNNTFENITLQDKSEGYSLLAIQGPKAIEAMQSLTPIALDAIKYYHFEIGEFAGFQDIIISATGYTGSGGFEIYCSNDQVVAIWEKVFEAGKSFDIKPIGLAARDTLRLEMGFCLYGNDINDTTSPLEAGLGWITKFTKDFTNSDNLKQQKEAGVTRKLIGFELTDRGIPRHDYVINDKNGNAIGIVTSGTQAPSLNKAIGMGYVKTEFATAETEIFIEIRGKNVAAKVVKMPFK